MKEDRNPTRFPVEIPAEENKKYKHGVIVDVVEHEITPTSATNPAKPNDTDSVNTEFAKQVLNNSKK